MRVRLTAPWLVIAFVDLDDFRTVNGTHGHAAGDEVLRRFSGAAITGIRRGDLIGRIGGDEFAIVVSTPNEPAAHAVARSLHARFMNALADPSAPATCSMGAVILPPLLRRTEAELIAEADRLMYQVKGRGKGAILVAHAAADRDRQAAETVRRRTLQGRDVSGGRLFERLRLASSPTASAGHETG